MTTGEVIKALRKSANLTQKDLSEKTGIPVITIQQYERGLRQPRTDKLVKIAEALNVPVGKLLATSMISALVPGVGGIVAATTTSQINTPSPADVDQATLDRILDIFSKLSPLGHRVALERLEELAKIPDYQKGSQQ